MVLTTPLLVSFYSFLVCWRSVGGAGMVVVLVVLVERLVAREKRKQELRLTAQCKIKLQNRYLCHRGLFRAK